ncbi:DUF2797 domain-containing protein [Microaerobacter geothermalis]|uniref:DUF2797 domain-containing protein n=1 Tax=Microaerobacter geothermalis TaxID=674972 RepID=UPI001F403444|nr:DUF2797 domain-containing protein [Microaerobacter geothermalis]MCF6093665.1 DUF2797 domain-containing protein [Microaerobacter geothermalis]
MLSYTGFINGLKHEYSDPVTYFLQLSDGQEILLNDYLQKKISVRFLQEIQCCHCGRKIKKTYNHGYCYPCFIKLPENDLCIVKPHQCHFDQGTCRDESFGERHCMIPHYVYLALSSDVKVGITRKGNERKRWVDQGAVKAIPIALVPDRKTAGELEVEISQFLPDKTNWRKMIKGEIHEKDLFQVREEISSHISEPFRSYLFKAEELSEFVYPVQEVNHLKSLSLDKEATIESELLGMKGQYLIFEHGVFHVKKHTGYKIQLICSS